MALHCLSQQQARIVDAICEAVVPGSRPAGPVVYLDALAADMPGPRREAFLGAVSSLAGVLDGGPEFLEQVQFTPAFQWLRALAIEAYYSGFAQADYTGPTAWEEIGFDSPRAPVPRDFSFLRSAG